MKSNFLVISLFVGVYLQAEVLVFSKAYELALQNAHSIKASQYKVQSTKERIVQAEAQLYPQINLSGYYKKSENSYYESNRDTLKQGLFNYGVSLKQSLYNASTYAGIDTEKFKNELMNVGLELEKQELAQVVFKAYLEVLKSNNKIIPHENYLEYTQSRLQELTKKYDLHMVSKMDLLEMQVEHKSATIDLIKEKNYFKLYESKLKQLIGNVTYKLPEIVLGNNVLNDIDRMKRSISDINDLSRNLSLVQSELELKIAKNEITSATVGHYPKLDFEASIYEYDTDNVDVQAPYKNTKSAMLVLNVPIYSGGSTSSRVREMELTSKSVNEDFLNVKKDIEVMYNESFTLFKASLESVSMYKDAYDSALLYVDAIEQGYQHGLKSIIDVNDAKNKQYEIKYKYIENIYEMVDSYIGLLIVTNDFENIELLDTLVE